MLKAAIEKIEAMARPVLQEIEGRTFQLRAGEDPVEVRPELDAPQVIWLNSLDALIQLIKTEALGLYQAPLYIEAISPTEALCFTQPDPTARYRRLTLYKVNATDVPGWEARTQMPFEEAMIALRTRFQATNDTTYALKLLSDITTGAKITYNDNGVATTVVTKRGVDLQANEAIRPIISLKPYRTFQEVEQPASEFLIRVNDRGISFVEADGGMWRLAARATIKQYLEDKLAAEIQDGAVVVTL